VQDPNLDARMRPERLAALEERLGHTFRTKELLVEGLSHASLRNEVARSNERLEFLGDAVLGFLISDHLFHAFPHDQEGRLTALRMSAISGQWLSKAGERLGLKEYVAVGRGFQIQGFQSIRFLADATEAVLGAIYVDGGIDAARRFVERHVLPTTWSEEPGSRVDWKSLLNLHVHKNGARPVEYREVAIEGPPHQRKFTVCVVIDGRDFPPEAGSSKKEAEQAAARTALQILENEQGEGVS
jgi:ribonuclease-3